MNGRGGDRIRPLRGIFLITQEKFFVMAGPGHPPATDRNSLYFNQVVGILSLDAKIQGNLLLIA